MTALLAQLPSSVGAPWWASPLIAAALVTAVSAIVAAFVSLGSNVIVKLYDRGTVDIQRKEERRRALFAAYAEWLTSFEAISQSHASVYSAIAREHEYGRGSVPPSVAAERVNMIESAHRFKAKTWKLRLLESDGALAKKIVELSRAFDCRPEDGSDLTAHALNWRSDMGHLQGKADEIIRDMQARYLEPM